MKKKILGLVLVTLLLGAGFIFADVDGCNIGDSNATKINSALGITCPTANGVCSYTEDQCGICCVMNTVYNITTWAFVILMAISSLMIIWGAVLFTTSSGDPDKTGRARQLIIYAAVGIVVALFAQAVPLIVKFVVGA